MACGSQGYLHANDLQQQPQSRLSFTRTLFRFCQITKPVYLLSLFYAARKIHDGLEYRQSFVSATVTHTPASERTFLTLCSSSVAFPLQSCDPPQRTRQDAPQESSLDRVGMAWHRSAAKPRLAALHDSPVRPSFSVASLFR